MTAATVQPRVSDEKRVTWAELFFDLVFVFAVTRAAQLLHEDHSALGVVRALVAFVPLYWIWVGNTIHANLHDVDTDRDRIGMFAVGLCSLLLAVALPQAYEGLGVLFGASYWVARLILVALVSGRDYRKGFLSFTVAATVTGPLMVIGGLLHGDVRLAVWALAAAIDLSVPWFARRRLADIPFRPDHLTERFGTFIIIALGETVVATAAGAESVDAWHLVGLVVAFVIACALWWVYFAYSPDVIRGELETRSARIEIIRPVLSYGHLALVSGIVAFAAAVGRVVADPLEPLPRDTASLLFGGAALYLGTFVFTRWRLLGTVGVPRLVAALTCLGLIALGTMVPAVAAAAVLAVLLIVLNVVERKVFPKTLHPQHPAS